MTQQEALKILKAGHSVYITGAAGSGKTYLLSEFIRHLKERGIGVAVTATTGIASTHLGGLTIHSWAGIGITREASDNEIKAIVSNRRIDRRFANTDTLIIDEISMFDAARLSLVDRVARAAKGSFKPFGGMQVVLCGDFFQLPPVARIGEPQPKFAYHSSAWEELNPKICYLTQQFRQADDALLKVLNAIRQDKVGEETKNFLFSRRDVSIGNNRVTKLYSHNINVDAENFRELGGLPGEEMKYYMNSEGIKAALKALKGGCLAPETLIVKKGAVVMFVKNNFEKGYVNGTLGKIVDFSENGYPIVEALNGKKIIATPESWSIEENGKILAKITQIPLRLAWAITIHKSQGMTLDAAEIDLSGAFEEGMGYVALSRVRTLRGIKLLGLNDVALKVRQEILEFDAKLRTRSEEVLREFKNKEIDDKENGKAQNKQKLYSVSEIRKSHAAAYKKWSSEEDEKLIADFRAGQTISALAKTLERKRGSIRSRLKKLGLT